MRLPALACSLAWLTLSCGSPGSSSGLTVVPIAPVHGAQPAVMESTAPVPAPEPRVPEAYVELARILTMGIGPTRDEQKVDNLSRTQRNPLGDGWNPGTVWITAYREESRFIEIQGYTRSAEHLSQLLFRLGVSRIFDDVKVVSLQAHEGLAFFMVTARSMSQEPHAALFVGTKGALEGAGLRDPMARPADLDPP